MGQFGGANFEQSWLDNDLFTIQLLLHTIGGEVGEDKLLEVYTEKWYYKKMILGRKNNTGETD